MQVIVLITGWVGPIEGVSIGARVRLRPLLQLVVVRQGLPSRVSWAQGAGIGKRLIGQAITALVALGPPSELVLGGLLPVGVVAVPIN
jgi:hypothetical protein